MRILVTFTGGSGHFLPIVPIAWALADRGASVLFSPQEAMIAVVEAAGFEAVASGGRTLVDPSARLPLQPVDREHEQRVLRDHFAGRTARERAARLLPIARDFQPDVLVRDEVDFGAAVVAEHVGIPHLAVVVLAAGGLATAELLAAPLGALRSEYELPPDPTAAMLHRHLTLVPVAPTFRDPDDPLPATARHIRPAVLETPLVRTAVSGTAVSGTAVPGTAVPGTAALGATAPGMAVPGTAEPSAGSMTRSELEPASVRAVEWLARRADPPGRGNPDGLFHPRHRVSPRIG